MATIKTLEDLNTLPVESNNQTLFSIQLLHLISIRKKETGMHRLGKISDKWVPLSERGLSQVMTTWSTKRVTPSAQVFFPGTLWRDGNNVYAKFISPRHEEWVQGFDLFSWTLCAHAYIAVTSR